MSARHWLMLGLARNHDRGCPPQLNNRTTQDDPRGRVATTTDGDAGLWWLPVADTNGKGNIARLRGAQLAQHATRPDERRRRSRRTSPYGFTDRFDVYAGWDFIKRVDRDNQVLFVPTDQERGGVDTRVPYARERWTGNKVGDLRVGAKYAFLSEGAGDPLQLRGARATFNLPTGDADNGARPGIGRRGRVRASSAAGSPTRSCSPAPPATTSARTHPTPSSCTCRTISTGAPASASSRRTRG